MNDGLLFTLVVPLSMFIMMLGLGTTLNTQALNLALKDKKPLLMGLFAQVIMLPVCAAIVVCLVDMPGEFKLGLMLLSCCPGGTTSNLFCYLGKGNLALSLTLTTFSSLMVVFTMPFVLQLSADLIFSEAMKIDIPEIEILKRLFFMTILPIIIGILISRYLPKVGQQISLRTGPFGLLFLLFLVGFVVINEWQGLIQYAANLGVTIFAFNLLVVFSVFLLLKLSPTNAQDRFTIYIEACIQSSALAMFIALTVLENGNMVAIPAGMFSLTMYIIGGGITLVHKRKGRGLVLQQGLMGKSG
ncbi:MAG: bile acid:sodium symporter [Bermanella sp.]